METNIQERIKTQEKRGRSVKVPEFYKRTPRIHATKDAQFALEAHFVGIDAREIVQINETITNVLPPR